MYQREGERQPFPLLPGMWSASQREKDRQTWPANICIFCLTHFSSPREKWERKGGVQTLLTRERKKMRKKTETRERRADESDHRQKDLIPRDSQLDVNWTLISRISCFVSVKWTAKLISGQSDSFASSSCLDLSSHWDTFYLLIQ